MRLILALTWVALVGVAGACSSTAPATLVEIQAITPNEHLASLDWLEGHWVGASPKGHWDAIYTAPAGGILLGLSKEFVGGEALFFEYEKFLVRGGEVVVIPAPNGVAGVAFRLIDHDPDERRAVFVNADHDFPTRIEYERVGAALLIHVTGNLLEDGTQPGFSLELERAD